MTNYTYDVDLLRYSGASVESQGQDVKLGATTKYRVRVNEDPIPNQPAPSTDPACVYNLDKFLTALIFDKDMRGTGFATDADLPIAQLDILYIDGKVWPFMHCIGVESEQNRRATQEVVATAKWTTPTFSEVPPNALGPVATPASELAYPVVWEHDVRLIDHVIYEDNDTPAKRCELPTGNLFTQPFIEKVAAEVVTVTQYESTFTEAIAASRLERVNDSDWNGTNNAHKWKISNITWQPVRIIVGAGIVEDTFLVQYTMMQMPKDGGWRSRRALLDTHYLTTAGDQSTRTPFVTSEGGRTNYIGMTRDDGTPDPTQIHYIEYVVQEEIAFTFLRAESP